MNKAASRPLARGVSAALLVVIALFFYWGFVNANNNPMVALARQSFGLGYTQALLIQIVFFTASGLAALPAAIAEQRYGTLRNLQGSLAIMAVGCLLVATALPTSSFPALLAALFVLACGNTALQVSANPLAAAMGSPTTAHARLTFAQALNSLGVVAGVHYGAHMMLGGAGDGLEGASLAYGSMLVATLVLVMLVTGIRKAIPAARSDEDPIPTSQLLADGLSSRPVMLGAAAIALYVGAEVAIGSIMIDFLHEDGIMDLPLEEAGWYLANLYWGGALAGRFIGSLLLVRIAAPRLLAVFGGAAAGLCAFAAMIDGPAAGIAALSVGFFNSIMFPTIFSLTLERSPIPAATTSGFLCLAISAGAIIPLLVGAVADVTSLSLSFAVPLLAYAAITAFALFAKTAGQSDEIMHP